MRRFELMTMLVFLVFPIAAETVRGPVVDTLEVDPTAGPLSSEIGLDEIILAGTTGDLRFFDALEIEITIPAAVAEFPGAFTLLLLTTGSFSERAGVAEINGAVVLSQPLTRAGKLTVQIPLHPEAEVNASAAVTVLDHLLSPEDLPLAITVRSLMKGLPPELAAATFPVTVRPVARRIGSVQVSFIYEDGSEFQSESLLAPEFDLEIDGVPVQIEPEYLLEPGLHRLSLTSTRYQDQNLTFGIEQARNTRVDVPLLSVLATVSYTAPRGSRVYVDGQALEGETGDFTALPGEHTIVVVVGDYTVTRRFSVEEGRVYNLSVIMDVAIEEAK
ncbi:MAG: hypothetical protein V3S41_02940 [Spirochaetia bacterium]